jgi:hypothetical protein
VRRALVLLPVLAAGLLGIAVSTGGAAVAAAPRAAAKPAYTIEDLYINRRVGGFLVSVAGGTDQDITSVNISRGHETASYGTNEWQLEGKTLTVRFGGLGFLHMVFQGAPDLGKRCGDRTDIDGKFKGEFRFRGEGGYVKFDVHSAPGQLGEVRDPCPSGVRSRPTGESEAERKARIEREEVELEKEEAEIEKMEREQEEEAEIVERQATLEAHTPGPLPSDRLYAVGTRGLHGKFTGTVAVLHGERRGSLLIERYTAATVGRTRFVWNLAKGAATVRPPAPFSGHLTYRGRAGGPGHLTGTLRAPTLGGAPIVIHGAELKAHLKRSVESDE